jgi:hypothetical protein
MDANIQDSTNIGYYPDFSALPTYSSFLPKNYEEKFRGLDDRDLLQKTKMGPLQINYNHVGYIEVSKQYMAASVKQIKKYPFPYIKHVLMSGVGFFIPASGYVAVIDQSQKIRYYDLVYSFNAYHFLKGKKHQRFAFIIAASVKFILYSFIFIWLLRFSWRQKKISLLNIFILITIAFVFVTTSVMEHGENMRFRYEIEPLFLLVFAQRIDLIPFKKLRLPLSRHVGI